MEVQKKLAIENEDFDSAKILKYEIDRVRMMAMNFDNERAILTPIRSHRPQIQDVHPNERQNDNYEDLRPLNVQLREVTEENE